MPQLPDDRVLPKGPFLDVVTSDDHVCGLRPDGSARCWQPINKAEYSLPGSWLQLDVDSFFSSATACGVRPDQHIECFSIMTNGTLSPATVEPQTDPTRLPPPGEYLELALIGCGGCAIRKDGALICWSEAPTCSAPEPPRDFVARAH